MLLKLSGSLSRQSFEASQLHGWNMAFTQLERIFRMRRWFPCRAVQLSSSAPIMLAPPLGRPKVYKLTLTSLWSEKQSATVLPIDASNGLRVRKNQWPTTSPATASQTVGFNSHRFHALVSRRCRSNSNSRFRLWSRLRPRRAFLSHKCRRYSD